MGRSAMGQPWLVSEIDAALHEREFRVPRLSSQLDGLCEQIEDSQTLYGASLGLRIVRKHVAAHIDKVDLPIDEDERRQLRADLCRLEDSKVLITALREVYEAQKFKVAA